MTRLRQLAAATAIASASFTGGVALAQELEFPDYYPETYTDMVEASRGEGGVVVYSNMAENNWGPVVEGFEAKFPWIDVQTLDLGSGNVHSRWEAEAGSNSRSADLLVSGANDRWADYGINGRMMAYDSPEFDHLPDFAKPYEGVSVLSTDPLVIVYNAAILSEDQRPTGFSSLVELAKADPSTFDGRLTTYDAARNAFGLAAWYYVLQEKGEEGWEQLSSIGPMIRGETSGGAMNEKITTGEYVAGYNISGITIFPRLDQAGGEILGFAFPDDGTPLMMRGMGIPENVANPNSAKLFFDYLLSQEGQTLLGKGGVVPYRDDVPADEVRYTYQEIVDEVGEESIIRVGFDEGLIDDAAPFAQKFTEALSGN
ncbi:ABC transporter substrate-binding protein [Lutibaculum baratangense]|uniref:Extracellular solute-binding protein, family 1 n=1 Tax=Lutibaculum baratangense AMV1 TaxID=631454 RepID=V4RQ67_9HYPH|nr:extracellular solute-binding protein [Lutibaculum baratangense]ESR27374.1 extracellular solute-binding protein, family 1 [Lutibaculum baratangense AMV1]